MALALDGTAITNVTANVAVLSLTTSSANDIICVASAENSGSISSIVAIGLTFTKRAISTGGQFIEYWTAVASSALSSLVITVNYSAVSFTTVCAFGISGADTTTKFDSNAVLPVVNSSSTITTLSTTAANTMLLSFYRQGGTASPAAGSGFTAIAAQAGGFALFQYKIVSSAQTNVSCGKDGGTTNGDANGGIADAILAASAAAYNPYYYRMIGGM